MLPHDELQRVAATIKPIELTLPAYVTIVLRDESGIEFARFTNQNGDIVGKLSDDVEL